MPAAGARSRPAARMADLLAIDRGGGGGGGKEEEESCCVSDFLEFLESVSCMFLKVLEAVVLSWSGFASSEVGLMRRCWMEAILGEILSRSPRASTGGTLTSCTSLSVEEAETMLLDPTELSLTVVLEEVTVDAPLFLLLPPPDAVDGGGGMMKAFRSSRSDSSPTSEEATEVIYVDGRKIICETVDGNSLSKQEQYFISKAANSSRSDNSSSSSNNNN